MRTVERVAFQSILHLKSCANAGGRHMHSRKLHPCSVSNLLFPVKSWLITNIFLTLLNQSRAVSYPLAHKSLSMWVSVVAVSDILLSLSVSLISFSTVKQRPGTVLPPCGKTDYCKITSVHMCDLSVQSTKIGWCMYSTRVLFWWRNSCHAHCTLSLVYA